MEYNQQPVFHARYTSRADHKKLAEYIENNYREWKRSDEVPSTVSWQDRMLPNALDHPEIRKLMDDVVEVVSTLSNEDFGVGAPWTIVNGPLEQIFPHSHEPNDLSVAYWVKVPENSGDLEFFDRNGFIFLGSVKPKAGDFVVFGSDQLHGVRHNASQQNRIGISFNIKFGSPEMK